MFFMNLSIALVAGLTLFEPFTRVPVSRFTTHRMRRNLAKRSYYQAGIAFFAALLIGTSQPRRNVSLCFSCWLSPRCC